MAFGSPRSSPSRSDCSITSGSRRDHQIGKGLSPTLWLGDVLAAPQSVASAASKCRGKPRLSALLSIDTTAAKPAAGSAETARRATNRRTAGISLFFARLSARSRSAAASGSTPYQIIKQSDRSEASSLWLAKRLGDRPALCDRNALQGRSQAQPHLRARVVLRQLGESAHRAGAGCLAVAKQPDCPGTNVLAGIVEQRLQCVLARGRLSHATPRAHAGAG